jgi:poly(hydroxyalkanoate) granule-associated protein
MAKYKQSGSKGGAGKRGKGKPDAKSPAGRLSETLSESAQQIWLAGVGAFGRAQVEGAKLFEALVREGSSLEKSARSFAGEGVEVVRGTVESTVGQAREHATDTWDRLEKVFEDRVHGALVKLGVPDRDDLKELSRQVGALTAELRRQKRAPARKQTPAKVVPAQKKAMKQTLSKRPLKTGSKATGKSSAKRASRKRKATGG